MTDKPYVPTKAELEQWAEIEALPVSVRYPIRRKACLERCIRLRSLIAHPDRIASGFEPGHVWVHLKREQKMLVKLRVWRTTGNYPADN